MGKRKNEKAEKCFICDKLFKLTELTKHKSCEDGETEKHLKCRVCLLGGDPPLTLNQFGGFRSQGD